MAYEIIYRRATLDDADIAVAVDMMKKLCTYQKMEDTTVINDCNMRKLLSNDCGKGIIVYVDGKAAAFMYYYYNYPMLMGCKCIYIDCLYIEEEFRHTGLGTQILGHISRLALDEGCERLEWMCLTWNIPALKMYDKIGAKMREDISVHRVDLETITKLANI